jgi:hypothetical protein
MQSLLIILSWLALGWFVVRSLPVRWNLATAAAAVLTLGLLGGTWLAFLSVLSFGYVAGTWISILLCLVVAWLCRRVRARIEPLPRDGAWIVLTLGSLLLFGFFNLSHDLQAMPAGLYSAGDTWGDIALHLTLASNFAAQHRFSWNFPIFHGAKLTYPFLIDFATALLHRGGWSWQVSFLVPSLLLELALVQLLYAVVRRLGGSAGGGLLAAVLFLGGGSAAGWLYAVRDWRAGMLLSLTVDYSHLTMYNLDFTNLVTSVLLPQRGIVPGVAAVLLICLLRFEREKEGAQTLVLVAGVTAGMLPLFHVHSWIVAMLLLVGSVLVWPQDWKIWFRALVIGGGLAIPQLAWQFAHTDTRSYVHFVLGWMRLPTESLPHFWWVNFGLLVPLMPILGYWLYRRQAKPALLLGAVGLVLFLVSNVLILQPNPFDNIKLLVFWYLFLSILLGWWLSSYRFAWLLAVPLCASGFLTLVYDGARSDLLVSTQGVAWAAQVATVVPQSSTILTSQQHNNPVSMLSGRPIVMGYPGWLWTYGIDYDQTLSNVEAIYAGAPNAKELLAKYGVGYVEIGPNELAQLTVNRAYFSSFPIVARDDYGDTLYKVL